MVEIFKSLEQAAGRLSPAVLVLPGVVVTVAGLIVWLGGLRFRRLSLVLAGAIIGGVFAFAAGIQSPIVAVLSILTAMVVAVIIPRLFTAVLLTKLVAGILFIVLAWSLLAAAKPRTVDGQQAFSIRESLDLVRAYALDLTDNIKHAGQELPPGKWLIVAVVGLVLLVSGFLFRHAAGALAFSILGTVLIWIGLVTLLMYKGSMPIRRIERDAPALGLAAVGMVAFGAMEQYVLCRRAGRKRAAKRRKDEQQEQESKRNWRGE